MSGFGDDVPADSVDTEPADPEQVARRLQRLRFEAGLDAHMWGQLTGPERGYAIQVAADLLAWLRREGSS